MTANDIAPNPKSHFSQLVRILTTPLPFGCSPIFCERFGRFAKAYSQRCR
jgi:hypothetical protein